MKTLAPLQLNTFAKIVVTVFFTLIILWGISNYIILKEIYLHWSIPVINGMLALIMGWLYYKNKRHTIFSYDKDGFQIQVGKKQASGQWSEFSKVSLVHLGLGEFSVRLYRNEVNYIEIPASALKLNPQEFRFELIQLVEGS
jgi:hypothetical protein